MTAYRAGYAKEQECRKRLEKAARLVVRSAGSKGCVDLVAIYGLSVLLVQVKFCAQGRSWKDANWRKLCALAPSLPEYVTCAAYVYRRGVKEPEIYTPECQ